MPNRHIEDQHQENLIAWSEITRINLPESPADKALISDYLIAIPNGGQRNAREGARLKKQGVKPGTPDLLFHLPVGQYAGLWIELKRPASQGVKPGRLTQEQRDKIKLLNSIGYKAVVCHGFKEAADAILSYLGVKQARLKRWF